MSSDLRDVQFRQVVRRFCEDKVSSEVVRRAFDGQTGTDLDLWRRLCIELGVTGMRVSDDGSPAAELSDVVVVVEELGRCLAPVPILSVAGVVELLIRCHTAAAGALLAEIGAGSAIPVFAQRGGDGCGGAEDTGAVTFEWEAAGERARLTGRWKHVLDGGVATDFILAVMAPEGLALMRVPTQASGVTRIPRRNLDMTRRQFDLELTDVEAHVIDVGVRAWQAVTTLANIGPLLVAADSVGGHSALVEKSADYARTRHQFGRPIGSFQAIKHMCADMLVSLELGRSLEQNASAMLSARDGDAAPAVSMAKAFCADAYRAAADTAIQIHGGMGYTWESDCHLYLRRAKTNQGLWGGPQWHRFRVARSAGLLRSDKYYSRIEEPRRV